VLTIVIWLVISGALALVFWRKRYL